MSLEGWIFMVGFRVFDLGLLVLWLVWFFRLRDDGEDPPEDGGGGGPDRGPDEDAPRDGGGMRLPLGRWGNGSRLRDHGARPSRARRRGTVPRPVPRPVPSRVRHPRSPLPARTKPRRH